MKSSKLLSVLLIGLYLGSLEGYYFGTNFLVNQNLDEPMPAFQSNRAFEDTAVDPSAYYGRDPETARYFRNLVNKFEVASTTDVDHEDGYQQRYYTLDDVVQPLKEKRFLKSFWEKIKPKKKDKKGDQKDEEVVSDDEFEDASDQMPTTPAPPPRTPESKTEAHVSSSILDDPFYKLKKHCLTSYDDLCLSKKKDMLDLVNKCESLQSGNKKVDACSDVLSIYCYVYLTRDLKTCLGKSYDMYIPGNKKYTPGATPSTTTRTTTTTRRMPIEIPINRPSPTPSKPTPPPTKSTMTKSTTTTTTTTTKSSPTPMYPPIKPNVGLVSPFDGPVKSIPNDAEKLKKIGNYCLRTKQRDQNCDKMLTLLKEKFKYCEKMPKSNTECQTFKINFCTAYPGFPCCADALAGRTCSGKQNARRTLDDE